jgi:hypothetical protein
VAWKQAKAGGMPASPCPAKPGRLLIQDATPEKMAEILSRDSAGALMVYDELAGWLCSFDRYNTEHRRAVSTAKLNGGPFMRPRPGKVLVTVRRNSCR